MSDTLHDHSDAEATVARAMKKLTHGDYERERTREFEAALALVAKFTSLKRVNGDWWNDASPRSDEWRLYRLKLATLKARVEYLRETENVLKTSLDSLRTCLAEAKGRARREYLAERKLALKAHTAVLLARISAESSFKVTEDNPPKWD